MKINTVLPDEMLGKILHFLNIDDFKNFSLVCKRWYSVSRTVNYPFSFAIDDEVDGRKYQNCFQVLSDSFIKPKKLIIRNTDLNKFNVKDWKKFAKFCVDLRFKDCSIDDVHFIDIISYCSSLRCLSLNDTYYLQRDKHNELCHADSNLAKIETFDLSCKRGFGLNDSVFVSTVGKCKNLKRLNMAGCKVVFAKGVLRRYYDGDTDLLKFWENPSNYKLTFFSVYHFVKLIASKLAEINLSSTDILPESYDQLKKCFNLKNIIVQNCKELNTNK